MTATNVVILSEPSEFVAPRLGAQQKIQPRVEWICGRSFSGEARA